MTFVRGVVLPYAPSLPVPELPAADGPSVDSDLTWIWKELRRDLLQKAVFSSFFSCVGVVLSHDGAACRGTQSGG